MALISICFLFQINKEIIYIKEHNHTVGIVSFVKKLTTTIVVVIMSFALNAANAQWWSKIAKHEELREIS